MLDIRAVILIYSYHQKKFKAISFFKVCINLHVHLLEEQRALYKYF